MNLSTSFISVGSFVSLDELCGDDIRLIVRQKVFQAGFFRAIWYLVFLGNSKWYTDVTGRSLNGLLE